jgi:succinate dehydrogenase / fumarate reductase cytochrome b subunit
VIAMIALSYHLAHGFQSAFQTLSIRSKGVEGLIRGVGTIFFALIIPALFAAMPIYFLFFK